MANLTRVKDSVVGKLTGWIRRYCWPLVGLAALGLVVWWVVWWVVPTWQTVSEISTIKERVATQIEFVKTLAQIALGVVVVGTLWAAWRRATAAERTVEVAQEGQITERFTKAVEQLGSDKMAIRLGGIYALERIAKDSEKDHWPVMEVLTAYVRENDWWKGQLYQEREECYEFFNNVKVPADIQAVLNVLKRRNFKRERPGQRLDLSGASLLATNIEGANLSGAILIDADLRSANLSNVNLQNADLRSGIPDARVDPKGADMRNANLTNANFQGANLGGVDLGGVDLRGAKNLTQEQVDSAITDEKTTKLPDYLVGDQNQ